MLDSIFIKSLKLFNIVKKIYLTYISQVILNAYLGKNTAEDIF